MRRVPLLITGALTAVSLFGQEANPTQQIPANQQNGPTPLYQVNVVARTTKAVSYGHRSAPTKIDFGGTILQPGAKGDARIKAERGVVDIEAKIKNLESPQRYGTQYLTYVLWAITPDGRATNLGELITDSGNDAKIDTATELQTFALIVTAEPYYAVTQPSDVVVVENVIRPDTIGRIETVDAKYELLKRGQYNYDIQNAEQREQRPGRKVSQREYESLVEIYQARNAVQLAEHAGAAKYAPEALSRAQVKLQQAEDRYENDPKSTTVVTLAREATQTAEDARLITNRKKSNQEEPVRTAGIDPTY